jgi:4-methyl-5(b-hydroxyethyl)-thiazole monophosphate biosynthesis
LTIAGLDKNELTGEQGLRVTAETTLETVLTKPFDVVILPGGDSGVDELAQSQDLKTLVVNRDQNQQFIAAICGAPRLLDAWGILDGRYATSYPEAKAAMKTCHYVEDGIVRDGHILTSRGPGTAMAFAYAILEALGQTATANNLREGMLYWG